MSVAHPLHLPACRFLHKMVQEGLLEPTESKDAYKVSAFCLKYVEQCCSGLAFQLVSNAAARQVWGVCVAATVLCIGISALLCTAEVSILAMCSTLEMHRLPGMLQSRSYITP